MLLKSLHLQGFKSFPDKISIDFGSGMTAIVGPNGSGKSNISDAVRWVLGEQSSKLLRGTKMEDVIFGGTQKRNPMGFCEVTLVIDNSDRTFKIDSDELSVTRRYYRSGESEYQINKKTCRLRDVHEIFMDTGLGRDGYSIIGQGRIDEILSVKSEDRREIFEEAAGISKFRYRKVEAERKLADAETNLVRVRDIIAELELQVGPLKKKAEKAQAYLKIRDELKGLEIDLWSVRIAELKKACAKAEGDLAICSFSISEVRARLEKLYAESARLSEEMQKRDIEAENARGELRGAEQERSREGSALAVLKVNLEHLLEEKRRIEGELTGELGRGEELKEKLCARLDELENLEKKAGEIKDSIARAYGDAEDASRRIEEVGAKIAGLSAREAEIRADAARAAFEAESARAAAKDLLENLSKGEEGLAAVRAKIEAERQKGREIAASISEQTEKLTAAENVISGYALRLKTREERCARERDAHVKLQMEINNVASRKNMLAELEREYEGYSKAVKRVMQLSGSGGFRGIIGTVGELVRVEDEHALAIETALGGALQDIVTENEQSARDAIYFLKARDLGRATFLPVTAIRGSHLSEQGLESQPGFVGIASDLCSYDRRFSGIFTSLLGRTAVAENLDYAIKIAKKFSNRFKIVTLDGQVIMAGGAMTGGSASKSAGILSRARELENLSGRLETLKEQEKQARERLTVCERELEQARFNLETAQAEKRAAQDVLLSLAEAEKGQKALLESLGNTANDLENDRKLALSRAKSFEESAGEFERKSAELLKKAEAVKAEIDKLTSGQGDIQAQKDILAEQAAELRAQLASAETSAAETSRAIEEIEKSIASESLARTEIERSLHVCDMKIDAAREEIEQRTEALGRMAEGIKACEQKIQSIVASRFETEVKKTRCEAETREQNDILISLEREQTRLAGIKTSAENEMRQISDRLWEEYELTVGEAADLGRTIENRAAAVRRVNELKSARKNLGEVDVGAIEEYKAVSERYEYLTAQAADIERSREELEKLIADITEEMRAIFSAGFEEIRKNFSETFAEIFDGGTAELVLDDPDDVLGSGITIKAQPPGKSLKTISLLSGGEKALVAIALYFAILKVHPTPFCVLDEIDAALDDVNVVRFNRYLKKLTAKTQFITMTHRRGTMENADILYGVTMAEQGVSKVLMLDLNEVERRFDIVR